MLTSRSHDTYPIVVSFYASLLFSDASEYAGRDSCTTPTACGRNAAPEASKSGKLRPPALGDAFAVLAAMARGACHRQARNSNCVAAKRVSLVLVLEEQGR